MLSSILALPADVAQKLDAYAMAHSTNLASHLVAHFAWTRDAFDDADRSSSLLQAQWMVQRARDMQAKSVLDIGCYTGLSALAWYNGTEDTGAEIFTIENDAKIATIARDAFRKIGCDNRVHILEGPAESRISQLTEPFDIIFVDVDFSAYRPIVEQILDRGLLSPKGVMIVDNVFARGFAIDSHNLANIDPGRFAHWVEAGRLVREFNAYVAGEPRVTVTMLPLSDGISEIRIKT